MASCGYVLDAAGRQAQGRRQKIPKDLGYTMVFFTDLADRLGVPNPLMDAIIKSPRSSWDATCAARLPAPRRPSAHMS
jgi:hypothetical protein